MSENIDNRPVMVSIKCLVYNHEPYLRDCLNGFVMQKTNFRFEAIVHDDASTDGSAAIIREYAEKYPDIIKPIYQTENQHSKHDGSIARAMVPLMIGKYIAWCEGDDYWTDPDILQRQVDKLESDEDILLCGSNGLCLWEKGVYAPTYFNYDFESHFLHAKDVIGRWPLPTASLIFRRELLDLRKDFKVKIYSGDIALILTAFANGKIWYDSNPSVVYRKSTFNQDSSTNRMKSKNDFVLKEQLKLYEAFDEYTCQKFHKEVLEYTNSLRGLIKRLILKKKIGRVADLIYIKPTIVSFKIKAAQKLYNYAYRLLAKL